MTPRRVLAIVAAAAVVTAGLTWAAASTLQSPDERAASTEAPEAGPVAVPVESRTVRSGLVGRATILFEDALGLEAGAGGGGGEGGGGGGSAAVVTTAPPDVGTEVGSGEAVFAVAGRPKMVLTGRLPAWRDLGGGDTEARTSSSCRTRSWGWAGMTEQQADGVYGAATAERRSRPSTARPATRQPETSRRAVPTRSTPRSTPWTRPSRPLPNAQRAGSSERSGPARSQRLQAEAARSTAAVDAVNARASDATSRRWSRWSAQRGSGAHRAGGGGRGPDRRPGGSGRAGGASRTNRPARKRSDAGPAGRRRRPSRSRSRGRRRSRGESHWTRWRSPSSSRTHCWTRPRPSSRSSGPSSTSCCQEMVVAASADEEGGGGRGPGRAHRGPRARWPRRSPRPDLAALTPFLQDEVAFVPQLPRLVQSRSAEVGDLADGAVATLAGARLTASVPVPTADLDEVTEGQSVTLGRR